MEIHDLKQGSPEWLAFRRAHRPASMAAVMLGRSPYMTRTAYLNALVTGIWPEPTRIEQDNFDEGHRTEALMRPIVEKHLGQDLYPVVGSDGDLSASLDGFFEDETANWENKLLNQELEAALPVSGLENADQNDARLLPQYFRDQLEQQCLVAKIERVLFTAARFAQDGTLLDVRACWYESDMDLAIEIVHGWKQFTADKLTHVPVARVEKVQAEEVEALPAIRVAVKGELTVDDNLEAWRKALTAYVARLPKEPKTDQDFANLADSIKRLKSAEKALEAEEERALNAAPSIEKLRAAIAMVRKLARDTRLANEKLVERELNTIKLGILRAAEADYEAHIRGWNDKLDRQLLSASTVPDAGIPEAMSGKKSVNGWREGASVAVAAAKAKVNEIGEKLEKNLAAFRELCTGQEHLFADVAQLVFKDAEAFRIICAGRISDAKAREEKRLADERARLEQEAREKAQRELEAAQRAAAAPAPTPAPVTYPPLTATQAHADPLRPAPAVIPLRPEPELAGAPAQPKGEPTLTLTSLNALLGFTVTAIFLEKLGIPPASTRQNAKLYHHEDVERIAIAIRAHLRQLVETRRQQVKEAA